MRFELLTAHLHTRCMTPEIVEKSKSDCYFVFVFFLIDFKMQTTHAWLLFCVVQNLTHSSPIEAFRKMLDPSNSINQSMKNEVVEHV